MSDDVKELAVRLLLICVAITWLAALWKWHRDPTMTNFKLQGMITTKDGFIDRIAFMELGSWIVFGLILAWLTVHDKFSETYAMIWVGWPAVRAGIVSFTKAYLPQGAQSVPTTTTTTDSAVHEVKVRGADDNAR